MCNEDDGSVKFRHHAYRKHLEEVKLLIAGSEDYSEASEEESEVETPEEPVTPPELFLEGRGSFFGESNPPVVEWRKKHWSKEAFDKKYTDVELLQQVYAKHDMIYDRSN